MEKQEYLKIRFKKDFLKYSLLQEDTISAKDIADKIYRSIDLTDPICRMKDAINSLCEKHLSFSKMKSGDKLTEQLPSEYRLERKDSIVAEYQESLESWVAPEYAESVLDSIVRGIEKQAWSNGVSEMSKAVGLLVERLATASDSYGKMSFSSIDEAGLAARYRKAEKISLLERMNNTNADDIIEYRSALLEYVRVKCENLLYAKVSGFYKSLAENQLLKHLQKHFEDVNGYALVLKDSLPDVIPDAELDREYNRMVPTDFYYRNVEDITPERAFQMVLFQFFAKNEAWMLGNGMLSNGELRVFTGNSDNLKLLLELCLQEVG